MTGFLDAAVVEHESRRNGATALYLDTSTTGADIDDLANSRRAFHVDKDRSSLGHHAGGPDPMKPSVLLHLIPSRGFHARTYPNAAGRGRKMPLGSNKLFAHKFLNPAFLVIGKFDIAR
jgi:hypothetical protein